MRGRGVCREQDVPHRRQDPSELLHPAGDQPGTATIVRPPGHEDGNRAPTPGVQNQNRTDRLKKQLTTPLTNRQLIAQKCTQTQY